jgi:cell division protein FtsI/penicillin-binding protein 2
MGRRKALTQSLVHAMQIRRLAFFAGCVITGFGALGYRLVDLQLMRHEELSDKARNNTERTIVQHARRGDLRDIKGNLLATSKVVHTVCADPDTLSSNYMTVAIQLAPVLDIPLPELAEMIRPRLRTNDFGDLVPVKWVQLKKKIETEEWNKVREAMDQLSFGVDEKKLRDKGAHFNRIRKKGILDEPEETRFYPNETLAAHVLGYVGINQKTNNGKLEITSTGLDGLELTLNNVLTGVHGWRQTETDSRQREIVLFREQDVAPRSGLNAILTIDSGIQHIVEDELAAAWEKHSPTSICSVVMRPKTGEILALAVMPTFSPGEPGKYPMENRRNRVIADYAEPGSTFKTIVVSAGFNENLIDLDTLIDCENGLFYYAGKPLHDEHPCGIVPVERVISKSSNIGAAKVGLMLGKERLYQYVRAFGFAQRTGIPLPGEVLGSFAKSEKWTKLTITRVPMGHEIGVTPIQMVMAISAIANNGVLMRPLLVDSFVDEQGQTVAKFQPQAAARVISPEAAAKMVTAMKSVVSTNGTGMKARLAYYTVAGKTGTAQKWVNGGYSRTKHYSSFIGFFPADNPELCISVVMDEPHHGQYGGETAAPVFARIAERAANYLAIPPDNFPADKLTASVTRRN